MTLALACLSLAVICGSDYSVSAPQLSYINGNAKAGRYSISGAPPNALPSNAMHRGGYTVIGQLSGIISLVQTPGSPRLTLERDSDNTLVLSWESEPPGFVLEVSNDLSVWTIVVATPQESGSIRSFRISRLAGDSFYRLVRVSK